jgi:serine/threonine protein kinase
VSQADEKHASTLPGVLVGALDQELILLERRIAAGWQILGACGLVASVVIGAVRDSALGTWGALATLPLLGFFSYYAAVLRKGPAPRHLQALQAGLESVIPWVFLGVIYVSEGPAYALASWVPPMLFAGIMFAKAARLRWRSPLIVGVLSALTFGTVYFGVLRSELPPEIAEQAIYQPWAQISRSLSLILAGGLTSFLAHALRRAIGRAEGVMRERDLFGKYRLVRHIASGGMGTVHEALYCPEGGFQRPVAIKRIHPHLASQRRFVEAFRTEAELCSRLVHPNVVQVLDFGSIGDTYFLAMEYVDGMTLSSLLRRARAAEVSISPGLAVHIGRKLLSGLAYAHDEATSLDGAPLHIIHRDICPANVLVSRGGAVKLTDFGVARALHDSAVVDTKTIAGHLGYMPPEQARGHAVDERTDLFALGVVLWEVLCGRPLFGRKTEAETILALVGDDVPAPSSLRSDLDPRWDAFFRAAVDRDIEGRYRNAASMAAALGELAPTDSGALDEALAALVIEMSAVEESARARDTEIMTGPDTETDRDAPTRLDSR